jgi:hypothetical protein
MDEHSPGSSPVKRVSHPVPDRAGSGRVGDRLATFVLVATVGHGVVGLTWSVV